MKMLPSLLYDMLQLAFRRGYRAGKRIGHFGFNFTVGPVTLKGKSMPLALKLTNEQQVTVHLNPVTPKGKPVTLDGAPSWSVAVGEVTVQPSEDGLSCVIVSSDNAGQSQILVTADADLGSGVDTISDTIDVEVAHQNATALGLSADAPVIKP